MPKETASRQPSIGMPRFLKNFDLFPSPIPSFNIKGKTTVQTFAGGTLSLIIYVVTLLFAALKLMHLCSKHNPSINTNVQKDHFKPDDIFDAKERRFMLAVTLADYYTNEVKDDPRYVKWFANYAEHDKGKKKERELPMHRCTDADYEKFYPVDEVSAERVN